MRTSEEQLKAWMISGLDGDAIAHGALLSALVPLLRNFYRRRVADGGDEIEDLVQDTLIAIHTRRMTFERDRVFSAWLFAIARYKMIDHFRRVRQHVPIDGVAELMGDEGFEDSSNARMDIDRLLDGLPPKQAGAIRATRIEGLSVAETAHSAGLGESDVKVSIHRGLKALSARIKGNTL
ncbi:MAG: sigma-70 family RNA polymerase sigma factor [Sphingomicrobium sp.]